MRVQVVQFLSIIVLTLLLATTGLVAQSHWWYPDTGPAVTLEFTKPHYNVPAGYDMNRGFLNMVGFIGGRHYIAGDLALFWELPFANVDVSENYWPIFDGYDWYYYYEEDQFAIGNPMIGLEQPIVGRSLFTRASIRFPVMSEENYAARSLGYVTSFDRFEAFTPKVYTIKLDLGVRESNPDTPMDGQVTLGTVVMVPSEGDAELFADYSGYLGVSQGILQVGGFFGGRFLISEDDIDFGERFFNFAGLAARLRLHSIEPGVHFRLNLDDYLKERIDYSLGVNLAVPLGGQDGFSDDEWN